MESNWIKVWLGYAKMNHTDVHTSRYDDSVCVI